MLLMRLLKNQLEETVEVRRVVEVLIRS